MEATLIGIFIGFVVGVFAGWQIASKIKLEFKKKEDS